MQCMALYNDAAGLYLATQDGPGNAKSFGYWNPRRKGEHGNLVIMNVAQESNPDREVVYSLKVNGYVKVGHFQ